MAVAYEEFEGSPTLSMDREGGSGKRVIIIAWGSIKAFLREIFPSTRFGWRRSAALPGYPWLRAQSVDVEPYDPQNPRNSRGMNIYPTGAKVTINYAPDKTAEPEDHEEEEKPGTEEIVFLENEINISGEYLTWPNQGVRWERSPAGTVIACGGGVGAVIGAGEAAGGGSTVAAYKKDIQVSEEIRVVPWTGIRTALGKVNRYTWAGALPETLLFMGCTASRQNTNLGTKAWKLTYKMHEKCVNWPPKKGVPGKPAVGPATIFGSDENGQPGLIPNPDHIPAVAAIPAEEPFGWNHFLRPMGQTTRWDRLQYGPLCSPVYPLVDFSILFKKRGIDVGSWRRA